MKLDESRLLILDQGRDHVVVYKPANMLVVEGQNSRSPTLVDVVQERFPGYVRPVHRIDRGTTGCCVFALSPLGQKALTEAFRRRTVDKRYLAIVEGEPTFKKMCIEAKLKRVDAPDKKSGALAWQIIDDEDGQKATTNIVVLATKSGRALIEARPSTGRMHQIRVHLAHVGHPIVDDTLYENERKRGAPHAFALHAYALSLPIPRGGRAFVIADPPPRFQEIWGEGLKELVRPLIERFRKSEEKAKGHDDKVRTKPSKQKVASATANAGPGQKSKKAKPAKEPLSKKKLRFTDDATKIERTKKGSVKRRKR